jgi:phosphoribosylglycinamide formyltransferase 2
MGVERALTIPETEVLLFGKPEARPYRRMGVALATGATTAEAQRRADDAAACIVVGTDPETVVTPGSVGD